jgi:hypothetical protein
MLPSDSTSALSVPRDRRLLRRATLALCALALLVMVVPASASAAKLQRHEETFWTWYAPKGWVAAHGRAGIDISSPRSGKLHVGQGWSGTAFPVTHQEVVDYLVQTGGLDLHPLRNVQVRGGATAQQIGPGAERRTYRWSGFRTDLRHVTRGILKVDVFDQNFSYGFAATAYNSPKSQWRDVRHLLTRLSKLLFYKPQSPDFSEF